MRSWSTPCTVVAVVCVVLSCSGGHTDAFSLCSGCPDLFAKTPAAPAPTPAQAQPKRRSHHVRLHPRRHHHRFAGDDTPQSSTVGRPAENPVIALPAFAPPLTNTTRPDTRSASVAPEMPAIAAEQTDSARAPSPATRIDKLFNALGAEPSDAPEAVASFRRAALAQLGARQGDRQGETQGETQAERQAERQGEGRRDHAGDGTEIPTMLLVVWFVGGMLPVAIVGIVAPLVLARVRMRRPARSTQQSGNRRGTARVRHSVSFARRNLKPGQKLLAR